MEPRTKEPSMERPEHFFWLAVILSFTAFIASGTPPSETGSALTAGVASVEALPENPFQKLDLIARSAFVYDLKDEKVIFEKNADEVLPLASITKLMTALTALSLAPHGMLIPITTDALAQEGDTKLRPGDAWPLQELTSLMLLESSNDAAFAVAEAVGAHAFETEAPLLGRARFIEYMNENARTRGLIHTSFRNETGLDLGVTERGAESTAREVAYLLKAALAEFPKVFESTGVHELALSNGDGESRRAINTNPDAERLPLLIASKTGYTDLAGGNLVVAFDAGFGHPIIIAVMGSTYTGRFEDTENLLWTTLEFLASRPR